MCRSAMLKLPLPSTHRKVSLVPGLVSSSCKEGSGTSPCKGGSGTSPKGLVLVPAKKGLAQ